MQTRTSALGHREEFIKAIQSTVFSTPKGECDLETWARDTVHALLDLRERGGKLFFIGNGASNSIASHFATDFTKNGNFQGYSLSDGALLTCFSNDYSYADSYKEMFKRYFKKGDGLVAISSSGNSANILQACSIAKELSAGNIFGFSGFKADNKLKALSDYGVYVPNMNYGFVESVHPYFIHMLIDFICEVEK